VKGQTGELGTWGQSYIHIQSGTTIDKIGKRRNDWEIITYWITNSLEHG
jgi:hypothetical protein